MGPGTANGKTRTGAPQIRLAVAAMAVKGKIGDLIVSRDGDKVLAIISLDGVLNLSSKLVAIPYQELRVTRDGKHVYYNATGEKLQGMPEFTYAAGERSIKTMPMDDSCGRHGRRPHRNVDRSRDPRTGSRTL